MLNNPSPGPNSSYEYIVSAIPWITSSNIPSTGVDVINFDKVTSYIYVRNDSTGSIRFAFTSTGLTSNYLALPLQYDQVTFDVRVKTLFLSGAVNAAYTVFAGQTNISAVMFPTLTASLGVSGIG